MWSTANTRPAPCSLALSDREEPDRAAAEDGDDVTGLDLGETRCEPRRREDVREQQRIVVADLVGQLDAA